MDAPRPLPLPAAALRRRCDPADLPFRSTSDVEPIAGVVGQDLAIEALRFGLATEAPGHNVFVRGLTGTGRMTLLRQILANIDPYCPPSDDHCYVHDFERPDQPRLITLPRGRGRAFGRAIDDLIDFVSTELVQALGSERTRSRVQALDAQLREELEQIGAPFEKELRDADLSLVNVTVGRTAHPMIFPVIAGESTPPEQVEAMHREGRLSAADVKELRDKIQRYSERLADVHRLVFDAQARHRDAIREVRADELRSALRAHTRAIIERFDDARVVTFVGAVIDDLVGRIAGGAAGDSGFTQLYRVNVLAAHDAPAADCPILIESRPSVTNLVGTIEHGWPGEGDRIPAHMAVRAGSLLSAHGGYLIVEVRDLLAEDGAWPALVRTLRSGQLQIAPAEGVVLGAQVAIKPEPIPLRIKVLLVGDPALHHFLDAADPDFSQLFKVLADFDTEIAYDDAGIRSYAGVLSKIVRDRDIRPFDASAVAALVEHGARIAGRQRRLTARFGRLADIAHEAAFLATAERREFATGADVRAAIARGRARADLPARKFRERIVDGTIRIETAGTAVGQINGLAVVSAGPLVFGFPTRITATIGAGNVGTISIEDESALSGSIHTKGFHILGGLLRHLLPLDHPLAFRASLAFEQSYGGIDGDSASAAETVCLLSALTGLPVRQDLAMTGAIDQLGHIQPVGAVTQKIEGFFDVCAATGLSGTQGVAIPSGNADELMLREDVVLACQEGRFHVYALESIHDALALFLGTPAGERRNGGQYPPDSVLGRAVSRARDFWRMVSQQPIGLPDPRDPA